MKSVQRRLFLPLFVATIALVVGVVHLYFSEYSPTNVLSESMQVQHEQLLTKVVELKGEALVAFAADYSRWDDMVRFVEKPDPEWAKENLEVALKTYHASADWVYDPQWRLVYACDTFTDAAPVNLPLTPEERADLFNDGYLRRFFCRTPRGLMELTTGPIQPSSDLDRTTRPRGFLIIGRIWDDQALAGLAKLTDTRLHIAWVGNAQSWKSSPEQGAVRFSTVFTDWQNHPCAYLRGEVQSVILADLYASAVRRVETLLGVAAILLLLWWLGLRAWVTKPLAAITTSLSTETSEPVANLLTRKDEFGQVAGLVARFFEQRRRLVDEMGGRRKAESALQHSLDRVSEARRELAEIVPEQRIEV